jgi:hypothetical protein
VDAPNGQTLYYPDNHIEGSSSERYSWVVDAL